MTILMAIMVGGVFATGFYMILRRSVVKLIIGLALISQSANLLIFAAGGLTRARPALIPENETVMEGVVGVDFADPLPQALILTAIVISFGVLAFAMVLMSRTYQSAGTDDTEGLEETDE